MTESRKSPASAAGWPAWAASAPKVLALLAVWLLFSAWLRPLLLPDEGRYGEVARQMWLGDGLVPVLNGVPFFHKPPLTYWVDMLGMSVFGPTPFSVRLGPALGAWLMGAALWLTLRRRQGVQIAGVALLVLATTPFFFIGGQYANHDMLVAGTITAAVLCFYRALADGAPVLRWLLLGWAFCGLAVLSKGLIGVVLPAIVIGPWLLAQGRWRDTLRLLNPWGLLLFAAVALPWMLAMQQRYPDFFDYFIVEQHFRRFAGSSFNNVQPRYFYLWVLPLLTLPWAPWAVASVARLRADFKAGTGASASASASPDTEVDGHTIDWRWTGLLVWWALVVLVFFSLPASKLVGYIMPALAPVCALLALPLRSRDGQIHRWLRPMVLLAALFCLVLVGTLAWVAPKSGQDVGRMLRGLVTPSDVVVLVGESFNDVVFEARLTQVPLVASDWDDPDVKRRDSWRKELADTVRFDAAKVAAVMYPIAQLPALVCRGKRVWLVEGQTDQPRAAAVPGAVRVLRGKYAQLWRAEPQNCAVPAAGAAGAAAPAPARPSGG
jgi:4-amino-4-deoxy-L-arabinose transferase-like glycosyltransferase